MLLCETGLKLKLFPSGIGEYHFKKLFKNKYCLFCKSFFVLCLLALNFLLSWLCGHIRLLIEKRHRLAIDLLSGSKVQRGQIMISHVIWRHNQSNGTVSELQAESPTCSVRRVYCHKLIPDPKKEKISRKREKNDKSKKTNWHLLLIRCTFSFLK